MANQYTKRREQEQKSAPPAPEQPPKEPETPAAPAVQEQTAAYYEQEVAALRAQLDQALAANEEIRKETLAELELVVQQAHSARKGIVTNRLRNWPGLDPDKSVPAWVVKATFVREGVERRAEGPHETRGGGRALEFKDGYAVTHDLKLARDIAKVMNGRTSVVPLDRG